MKYFLLSSALSLSAIAAYFSIIGLSTIFPGSIVSIVVMAVGLEVAKIVVAVWTHQNWEKISILTRAYLSFSVFILMAITSAGIFGFLSKSHIEHSSSVSFAEQNIKEIDRKILLEEESIDRQKSFIIEKKSVQKSSEDKNSKIIEQLSANIELIYSRLDEDIKELNSKIDKHQSRLIFMDEQLQDLRNQKTGFFSSNSKKIKDLEVSQLEEREYISSQLKILNDSIIELRRSSTIKVDDINNEIRSLQNSKIEIDQTDLDLISMYESKIKDSLSNIEVLNLEKFKLESDNLKIENELGPVKYIAELIKDFGGPDLNTAGSIRLVIIFIVCVFDPLAIVMVICASNSFKRKNKTKEVELKKENLKEEMLRVVPEAAKKPKGTEESKVAERSKAEEPGDFIEKNGFIYKAPKNKK